MWSLYVRSPNVHLHYFKTAEACISPRAVMIKSWFGNGLKWSEDTGKTGKSGKISEMEIIYGTTAIK